MKKVIIDTNGYLRLLLDDIPAQANHVESILKKAQKGETEIFLPQIVIFEVIFTLEKYYGLNKEQTVPLIESLISTEYITVELKDVFLESLGMYKGVPVSFVDCFLVSLSKSNKAEIVTFDKKLKNLS